MTVPISPYDWDLLDWVHSDITDNSDGLLPQIGVRADASRPSKISNTASGVQFVSNDDGLTDYVLQISVPKKFTIEFSGVFTPPTNGFNSSERYLSIGVQDKYGESGLIFMSLGDDYIYLQTAPTAVRVPLGSARDDITSGENITFRLVTDGDKDTCYVFVTKTADIASTGHQLRGVVRAPNSTAVLDSFSIHLRGSATNTSTMVLSTFGMSSRLLQPLEIPVAHIQTSDAVAIGDLVYLDGSQSSDLNNRVLSYQWRIIETPYASEITLAGSDSATVTFTSIKFTARANGQSGNGQIIRLMPSASTFFVNVNGDVLEVTPKTGVTTVQDVISALTDVTHVSFNTLASALAYAEPAAGYSVNSLIPEGITGICSGGKDSSTVVTSFTPDLIGVYRIGLTVSCDGAQSIEVTTDVYAGEANITLGYTPDASYVWKYLPDFWKHVRSREPVETFWSGVIQKLSDDMVDYLQAGNERSIGEFPIRLMRRWVAFKVREDLEGTITRRTYTDITITPYDDLDGDVFTNMFTTASTTTPFVVGDKLLYEGHILTVTNVSTTSDYPWKCTVDQDIIRTYDVIDPGSNNGRFLDDVGDESWSHYDETTPKFLTDTGNFVVTSDVGQKIWFGTSNTGWTSSPIDVYSVTPEMVTLSSEIAHGYPHSSFLAGTDVTYGSGIVFWSNKLGIECNGVLVRSVFPDVRCTSATVTVAPDELSITDATANFTVSGVVAGDVAVVEYTHAGDTYHRLASVATIAEHVLTFQQALGDPYAGTIAGYTVYEKPVGLEVSVDGRLIKIPNIWYYETVTGHAAVETYSRTTYDVYRCLMEPLYHYYSADAHKYLTARIDPSIDFTNQGIFRGHYTYDLSGGVNVEYVPWKLVVPIATSTVTKTTTIALAQTNATTVYANDLVEFSNEDGTYVATVLAADSSTLMIGAAGDVSKDPASLEYAITLPDDVVISKVVHTSVLPSRDNLVHVPYLQETIELKAATLNTAYDPRLRLGQDYRLEDGKVVLSSSLGFYTATADSVEGKILSDTSVDFLHLSHITAGDRVILNQGTETEELAYISSVEQHHLVLTSEPLEDNQGTDVTYRIFAARLTDRVGGYPDRLWAEVAYFDNSDRLNDNFGVLVGLPKEAFDAAELDISYLSAIRGLMFVLYRGPSMSNIRIGSQIFCNLPFAEEAGTIEDINENYDVVNSVGKLLIRGTKSRVLRSYYYSTLLGLEDNLLTGAKLATDDDVQQFQPISKGVRIDDYLDNPYWFHGYINEIQKYHVFRVVVDADALGSSNTQLLSTFVKTIKPAHVDVRIVVSKVVSDEIELNESVTFNVKVGMQDDRYTCEDGFVGDLVYAGVGDSRIYMLPDYIEYLQKYIPTAFDVDRKLAFLPPSTQAYDVASGAYVQYVITDNSHLTDAIPYFNVEVDGGGDFVPVASAGGTGTAQAGFNTFTAAEDFLALGLKVGSWLQVYDDTHTTSEINEIVEIVDAHSLIMENEWTVVDDPACRWECVKEVNVGFQLLDLTSMTLDPLPPFLSGYSECSNDRDGEGNWHNSQEELVQRYDSCVGSFYDDVSFTDTDYINYPGSDFEDDMMSYYWCVPGHQSLPSLQMFDHVCHFDERQKEYYDRRLFVGPEDNMMLRTCVDFSRTWPLPVNRCFVGLTGFRCDGTAGVLSDDVGVGDVLTDAARTGADEYPVFKDIVGHTVAVMNYTVSPSVVVYSTVASIDSDTQIHLNPPIGITGLGVEYFIYPTMGGDVTLSEETPEWWLEQYVDEDAVLPIGAAVAITQGDDTLTDNAVDFVAMGVRAGHVLGIDRLNAPESWIITNVAEHVLTIEGTWQHVTGNYDYHVKCVSGRMGMTDSIFSMDFMQASGSALGRTDGLGASLGGPDDVVLDLLNSEPNFDYGFPLWADLPVHDWKKIADHIWDPDKPYSDGLPEGPGVVAPIDPGYLEPRWAFDTDHMDIVDRYACKMLSWEDHEIDYDHKY
jgi:hypothetical protein